MPININGLGSGSIGTDKSKSQEHVAKPHTSNVAAANGQAESAEDKVKLSPEVKILRKLESDIQGMSDVDQSKIDSIKSAIQNGEYQINYDRLASAMEKFESDF